MRKGFLCIFFSRTDFFPKILIFLVIYTDFVLDQNGRSVIVITWDARRLSPSTFAHGVDLFTRSHDRLVYIGDLGY